MKLCKADITSKNNDKVKKYLNNFARVEQKLKDVEERDSITNFQPPITGQIIMDTFALKPSRVVGEIKDAIREAIIEGKIPNNFDGAYTMMLKLGKQKGLKVDNKE
jgi:hypothetical protein